VAHLLPEQLLKDHIHGALVVESKEDLEEAKKLKKLIVNGDEKCVQGVKYDFRLSRHVLKAGGLLIDLNELSDVDQSSAFVRPGESVFVLTMEVLCLPGDVKAEISTKVRLSHQHIQMLGGFCVDPGYSGRLMFVLHNKGSTPWRLRPGKKLVAAQFYRLDAEEIPETQETRSFIDFPSTLVQAMTGYEPPSTEALGNKVSDLKGQVEKLETLIHDRFDWFKEYEESLKSTGKKLDDLAGQTAITQTHLEHLARIIHDPGSIGRRRA